MSENYFRSHSDQYETFFFEFILQNGRRHPIANIQKQFYKAVFFNYTDRFTSKIDNFANKRVVVIYCLNVYGGPE